MTADSISHLDVFMALLQLLRQAPLAVRNTLCQLLTSILHHTPEDILRLSAVPGWEVVFLWLLTPFYPHLDHNYPLPRSGAIPPSATPTSMGNGGKDLNKHKPSPPTSLPLTPVPNGDAELSPPHYSAVVLHRSPLKLRPSTIALPSPGDDSPSQIKTFRGRSSAMTNAKTPGGSEFTVTESGELKSLEELRKERKVSLQVSTPWAEPVQVQPEEEDAEVVRAVDIVTQLFRCILWSSTIDQKPWMVSTEGGTISRQV